MNGIPEALLDLLKFAPRQRTAFYEFLRWPLTFFKDFSFKKALSAFMVLFELIGSMLFDTAVTPHGQTLDLTGYALVFEDEFNGDALDTAVWRHRGLGKRRGGFNGES